MTYEFVFNKEVADSLKVPAIVSPTYGGRPVITVEQAEECLAVVRKLLGSESKYATLYQPGHEGAMWVISAELGDDWPIRLAALDGAFPEDVFVEPVTGWCLGLYPA